MRRTTGKRNITSRGVLLYTYGPATAALIAGYGAIVISATVKSCSGPLKDMSPAAESRTDTEGRE